MPLMYIIEWFKAATPRLTHNDIIRQLFKTFELSGQGLHIGKENHHCHTLVGS